MAPGRAASKNRERPARQDLHRRAIATAPVSLLDPWTPDHGPVDPWTLELNPLEIPVARYLRAWG